MTSAVEARKQFLRDYRQIRHAEGRGSPSSDYYEALPFKDISGRSDAMWSMRAKTYRYFEANILKPLEARMGRPLDILDLGAGNCWLSYRLSLRQHRSVAIDIFADELDGLGAAKHYPMAIPVIESDFDNIPLPSESFDLAVFNASLHYSTDYIHTLTEARRCLRRDGALVILDSPIYRRRRDGIRMAEEKHADFEKRYGFPSDALPSEEFLDVPMLHNLDQELGIDWEAFTPWYGWRWHYRPVKAWLRGRRPPSKFWILVGTFRAS